MVGAHLPRSPLQPPLLLLGVAVMAGFFAMVEIQIEGGAGWAASLPTWRIEHHWLLDIFWGGRPMTGYHAWVFPFMAMVFHLPLLFSWVWSWRLEARALSCIMAFWLIEDFLWFVLNPAFGLAKFSPAFIPWHIHWFWFAPVDYWTMSTIGLGLYLWSWGRFRDRGHSSRDYGQLEGASGGARPVHTPEGRQ